MTQVSLDDLNNKTEQLRKEFEKMKEDMEFALRTEEAWKEYERGEFISQPVDEFLKELEKC
ncbi:hypothetical protein J4456_03950 [Candidatus Pacearchaeota archaeon]|nr:hypothetical protein [Candidatus Pacearchaeota archaeon]